ncbi:MAG: BT4734/BF3469 family protein, partial [Methylococcales bacterium]
MNTGNEKAATLDGGGMNWQASPIMSQASLLPNAAFEEIDLRAFLAQVKKGSSRVTEYRELFSTLSGLAKGCDEYEKEVEKVEAFKKSLPGFTVAGTFKGRRANATFVKCSGIFLVDIDKIPDPEAVKEQLKTIPSLAFVFISPSENGVKA